MNNVMTTEHQATHDSTQQPLSDQFRNLCTLFAFDAACESVERIASDFTANVAACLRASHTSRLQLLGCHDWQVSRFAGVHYYLTSFGFGLTLKQLNSGDYVVGIRLLTGGTDSRRKTQVEA